MRPEHKCLKREEKAHRGVRKAEDGKIQMHQGCGRGWTGGGGSWLGSCHPQGGLAVAPEDLEATGTPLVPGAAIGCVGA